MESSYDAHPTAKAEVARSVIAGYPATGFAIESNFTTPSGGILSTISDLSKLGIGILNNTLISAQAMRKWMKPQTHTASLSYSIGAGFEIHRYVHPSTGKVTDLYTKLGDSGSYGGALVLIPQYDAGFAMLNAYSNGTIRPVAALVILDYVTDALLPALEAQAAVEAQRKKLRRRLCFNRPKPQCLGDDRLQQVHRPQYRFWADDHKLVLQRYGRSGWCPLQRQETPP